MEARIKLVQSRYANIKVLDSGYPTWFAELPECKKAIQDGIYDSDCLTSPKVCEY